eukprot:TRINITY_DN10849_c0_g1_i1.p1 TRINITY_DN10849_c0_g1~~TRINITY_DN10849_c0_g1_i1.p1  ORF type:complete len:988 (-),score=251.34 TRINITY_DN10849_c0_g1_i1:62-3025(-)
MNPNLSGSGTRMKSPGEFALKVPPPPKQSDSDANKEDTLQSTPSNSSSAYPTNQSDASLNNSHEESDGKASLSKTSSQDEVTSPQNSLELRRSHTNDEEAFRGQSKQAKLNTRVTVTGSFQARHLHTAVNYEDFMFVVGGFTGDSALADLSCFHFATRTWSTIENDNVPLIPRYDHSAVVYGDSMFVFGGTSGPSGSGLLDDLLEFKFELQSWSTITGDGNKPGKRRGHSAVVHENSMYIIGGIGPDEKPLNDIYEFSFDTLRWQKISPGGSVVPSPKYHHSAVVFKDSIFVFGGNDGTHKTAEFMEYRIKTKLWNQISAALSPSPRDGHAAVVFQNSMYLIGGGDALNLDIFEFDFDFRKWFKINTPGEMAPPNQFFTGVVRGDCIFFLGGTGPNSKELQYLCLGKDEFEEEFELDEMAKMKNIPKSMWEAFAMKKHPEMLELRERLRPLSKAISYARSIASAKTEAKSAMPYQAVLQLIMEYLDNEGYSSVIETIEEESNVKYQKMDTQESRLMTLLRIGRRRVRHKDIFGPDIRVVDYDETDPEVEVVDHLPGRNDTKEEHDVNIWEETADTPSNIVKSKQEGSDRTVIVAATLNKLVQHLTSEKEKVHDVQFMRTFLYSYQSFTSPEMLLKKLIQRYHVPLPKGMPEDKFKAELQQPIRSRVCNVIKYWVDKCSWDFNEKLLSNLNAFIDGPLSRDGNLSLVKQLRNSINKLHKKKNISLEEERNYVFGVNPPEPKVPKGIFSPNINFSLVDEVEIARQLTLIEFNIFSQIVPTELLNKVWIDPDQRHKAPHVLEMLNRFDNVVSWVAYSILTADSKRNRALMIVKFIRIAENLKTLKNFQTLFAVLTGLNSPAISRLSQTMVEIPIKTKEVLNDLLSIMSKENNYKTYREFLRYSALPCILFLEVVLKDVLVIEDQNPDFINGLINFQKRQLLYRANESLQGYQQRPYNLQPVHQIETILTGFPRREEKELMELSFRCEPKK